MIWSIGSYIVNSTRNKDKKVDSFTWLYMMVVIFTWRSCDRMIGEVSSIILLLKHACVQYIRIFSVSVCVCEHVHVCVEERVQPWVLFLWTIFLAIFDLGFLAVACGLSTRLCWLARKLQTSACLCLLRAGIIIACLHVCLFTLLLRIGPGSSQLCSTHLPG